MLKWLKNKHKKQFPNNVIWQSCGVAWHGVAYISDNNWTYIFYSETCSPDDDDVVDRVKLNTSLPEPLFKIDTTDEEIEAFFADDEKVTFLCMSDSKCILSAYTLLTV